jgi:hypothetical protein
MNRYKTNSKSNSILILENKLNTIQSVYVNMNYPIKLDKLKLDYYDYHGKECSYTFDNEQDMNKFIKKLNQYYSNCSHHKMKYIIGLLVVAIGLGCYFGKGDVKNNQTNILNTPEAMTSTLMEQHGELKRQQSLFPIKPLFPNNQVTPSNPIPETEEGVLTNMVNKPVSQDVQTQTNTGDVNNTSESDLLNKLHTIKQQAQ